MSDYRIGCRNRRIEVADGFDGQGVHTADQADEAIQWAIDRAGAEGGGEVRLCSGRFALSRPLEMRGKVVLRGAGKSTVVEQGGEFAGQAVILAHEVNGFAIERLLVRGRGEGEIDGVVLDRCGDAQIFDVGVYRCGGYGIVLRNDCLMTLTSQCVLAGNAKGGILLRQLAKGHPSADFPPNRVLGCRIYRGGFGIECERAILVDITACSAFQTGRHAFYLHRVSNSVLVTGCRAFQTGADAFVSEHSHELNLTGNIFCWQTGCGVRIKGCVWGTITGNCVIDSGSWNPGGPDQSSTFGRWADEIVQADALVLEGAKGFTVSGNAVFSWPVAPPPNHGVREDADCSNNVITGNMVNYVSRAGLVCGGQDSIASANAILEARELFGGRTYNPDAKMQSFQPGLMDDFIERMLGD